MRTLAPTPKVLPAAQLRGSPQNACGHGADVVQKGAILGVLSQQGLRSSSARDAEQTFGDERHQGGVRVC